MTPELATIPRINGTAPVNPAIGKSPEPICTVAAHAEFRVNYRHDDPGYRVWTRTGNAWEEKLPSGRVKRFQTMGRDIVDGRTGCILLLQASTDFEVSVSDRHASNPQLSFRQGRGNWGLLGTMEDVE